MLKILLLSLLTLTRGSIIGLPAESYLNYTELIVKNGLQCEEFDVVTEDGYILKVFRIKGNEGKRPVLLMHGILDSSDSYALRGEPSISISLARAGYDVWAGNCRGNKYSRRHVKLSPDKDKMAFFNFTYHEMGKYDLPATIDLVLKRSGKNNLAAIGHSQGTTIFFVLGSERPEYNDKISLFIALAPVVYLNNVHYRLTNAIRLWPAINAFFKGLGFEEIMPSNSTANDLYQLICVQGQLGYEMCLTNFLDTLIGSDPEELELDFHQLSLGHFPAGGSRKTIDHHAQVAEAGRFVQYNHGVALNRKLYKSGSPPEYNLRNVTMRVALMVGRNDPVSDILDVERLRGVLPNVVYHHIMERELFSHADFIWGKHVLNYMIPVLKDLLSKFV